MSTGELPVIDVSDLTRPETRRMIDAACRDWGMFYIVGHGIDDRVIGTLQRQMLSFFAQPLDTKREILPTAENPWGFYDRELTKHTPDWKQVYDFGPPDGAAIQPQWPTALPEFPSAIQAYYDACDRLSLELLSAFSVNLGLPQSALDCNFRP